jgi:Holliday junction DNA helicase RuvB
MLSEPLRSRFGIFLRFDFYNEEEISSVILRSAKILDVEIEKNALSLIARCSRGTPRIANRLLRRIRDYSQVKGTGIIDTEIVKEALNALKIDDMGLDEFDRKYLKVLIEFYNGGPCGVEAIAANMGESSDTLIDVIEPYLMKLGFVKRSLRGRVALDPAWRHLGKTPPEK